jgi:hypothetical protein
MKNEIIELNRGQTNGSVHTRFAVSPNFTNPGTVPPLAPPHGPLRHSQPPPSGICAEATEAPDAPPAANGKLPHTPNSALRTASQPPSVPSARNGKIARLPDDIREYVNGLLRAGLRYIDIIAELKRLGHADITEVNISNWKHNGYLDWLEREQAQEARAAIPRAIEHCTHAVSIDRLHQNVIALACDQLTRIMDKFDADRALEALYQKPQLFPAFIGAIASLGRCTADLAKAFDLSQNREAKIRGQIHESHPNGDNDAPASSEAPSDLG